MERFARDFWLGHQPYIKAVRERSYMLHLAIQARIESREQYKERVLIHPAEWGKVVKPGSFVHMGLCFGTHENHKDTVRSLLADGAGN